ncbi:hypothetical protein Patl1_07044 [Pistacia atlantica]|uniref:Uncharacterized protein n=1 Tax=Pistacia atlantica TaxID=434234 RepID=A0ACC1AHM1_9ROSI|nr:hypothetical protein Patl1_07044 [Pistacia atlantica]
MDNTLYPTIELSYALLNNEEAKSLFLLCALSDMGTSKAFMRFLAYDMRLGLFQDVHKINDRMNRIKSLIDYLEASCLLLKGNNNETVKMHDIAHMVVASIAKEKCMLNIQDANDFKEVLVKGLYKDSIAICLHHGDIDGLLKRGMYKDSIAICLHHGDVDGLHERLKISNPRCVPEMDNTFYSTIELSYALSNCEEAKSLVLLCALSDVGTRIPFMCFLAYDIGLGSFQDVHTVNDRMNIIKSLIDYLEASCLLLKGNNNEMVKMHDIAYMVVASIAKEKRMFSIQDANGFEEVLVKGMYNDSIAICLHHGDIDELPKRVNFLNLQLLALYLEKVRVILPGGMRYVSNNNKTVKMHDIAHMIVASIAKEKRMFSIQDANGFEEVLVKGMYNDSIAICLHHGDIDGLPKRETKSLLLLCALSDVGTSIPFMCFLAYGMGLGNNNETVKMHDITHMVVASIAEEKRMFNIQDACGFKEVLVKGMYKDSIAICLHYRDIDGLPERIIQQDFILENLGKYEVNIGDGWVWSDDYENSRTLRLKCNGSLHLKYAVEILVKKAKYLCLHQLDVIKDILWELDREA